jgi:outer membrane protein OmpA-like peptidoglycan-associated protein
MAKFISLRTSFSVLIFLTLSQDVTRTEVAANPHKFSRSQSMRDTLFKTLKAEATEYSFDYVVIYVPSGEISGITVPVPVSHVRFSSTIFFAFDKSSLEMSAETAITELAKTLLKDKSFRSLLIVGHTDSTGPDEYNASFVNRLPNLTRYLECTPWGGQVEDLRIG